MTQDHRIVKAEDVTDEVLEQVQEIIDGWYGEGHIDWLDVWDRLERRWLSDGRGIDMGESSNSPAMQKIQREIRKWRSQG